MTNSGTKSGLRLGRGVGPDDLQKFLAASNICDFVTVMLECILG